MPSNSRASLKKSPFEDLPDDQKFETFDDGVVSRIMAIRKEFDEEPEKEPENEKRLVENNKIIEPKRKLKKIEIYY